MTKIKIGDWVIVNDPGLIMLQQFAPQGSPPNNEGRIAEIMEDGYALIEFPIGNDDIDKHSQVAPYPLSIIIKK